MNGLNWRLEIIHYDLTCAAQANDLEFDTMGYLTL